MITERPREKAVDDFSAESRDEIKKVTIGFRPHDLENIEYIREATKSNNNAQAVGLALSLARFLVETIANGEQVLIRNRDKELERVRLPQLDHLQRG
jgi:hypothetical protein